MNSVGTTYKRATSKIIRPLYEHQDANLHDKLQLVSLQISDEPKTFGRAYLLPVQPNVFYVYRPIVGKVQLAAPIKGMTYGC